MIQRGGGLRLAFETLEGDAILGDGFGQEFQRDLALQLSVFSAVDHTHATTAQFFDDLVMRNGAANQRCGVSHERLMLSGEMRGVNARHGPRCETLAGREPACARRALLVGCALYIRMTNLLRGWRGPWETTV